MKKLAMMAAVAVLAVSCNMEKAEEATTGEAQEVEAVVEATNVALDSGSVVAWRGFKSYVASEHVGTIGVQEGTFAVLEGKVVGGSITIDMNAIVNTDLEDEGKNAYLVGHLKSQDFFFVDSFATSVFEIVEVKEAAAEGTNSVVVGNLTLRGVTNSIEFPANIAVSEGSVSFDAPTFSIDRTKWGVKFHDSDDATIAESLKEDLIDHSIELTISVTATQS
ncbi:MAG: YceI family protein [Schleiferiaceae bacterium]|nr:MAG: Protein YceI [Cryomorphaceae bacterium]